MCLAVPGRVVEVVNETNHVAQVDDDAAEASLNLGAGDDSASVIE